MARSGAGQPFAEAPFEGRGKQGKKAGGYRREICGRIGAAS